MPFLEMFSKELQIIMNRNKEIIRTSIIGILGNLCLSAFKLAVGYVTNSIAIRMDAVNNITDALSSLITIAGTKLSEKEPDRKHPFGYGRLEYLTSLTIGILILYAGITAVIESVGRIIRPQALEYSSTTILIVAVAVVIKIVLGKYTQHRGKVLDSSALTASGKDAIDDSIETGATLLAAIIYVNTGVNIEAYVGLVISVLIFRTGIETLRETVSSILGESVDISIVSKVRESILSFPEVDGVFDIVIHNYGKEKLVGSAYAEVPDVLTAGWIDNLQRAVAAKVYKDTGVELMGLSIYAVNSKDREAAEIQNSVRSITESIPEIRGMHGFYLDKVDKEIKFDIVTGFDVRNSVAIRDEVEARVYEVYPDYDVSVVVKKDLTE